jgi:polar amino acid transport system substrate-binding protein
MPLNRRLSLLASLGAPFAVAPAWAQSRRALSMVNTVYPPFVNPAGHRVGEGMDVELAREALGRAGFDMTVQLLPWRRVLYMLESGQADFTTTISRQPSRDGYLAWSHPYRMGANYRVYTRKAGAPRIEKLSDLEGLRLGLIEGFHYPPSLLQVPRITRVGGRDIPSLVAMLLAGRTDGLVVTAIAGAWEIRERGLQDQVLRQPYEHTSTSPNYLGFAKGRPNVGALEAVSAALKHMAKDGTQARIESRYRV